MKDIPFEIKNIQANSGESWALKDVDYANYRRFIIDEHYF